MKFPETMPESTRKPEDSFPACFSCLSSDQWRQLFPTQLVSFSEKEINHIAASIAKTSNLPEYFSDLFKLEAAYVTAKKKGSKDIPESVQSLAVNPSLQLIQVNWHNLHHLLQKDSENDPPPIEKGEEFILLYCNSRNGTIQIAPASDPDLLALKIVAEGLKPDILAKQEDINLALLDQSIARAAQKGLLLRPASKLQRPSESFPKGQNIPKKYFAASVFTLQWHITQQCDLHCKHCYDRSERKATSYSDGIKILDDLRHFSQEHNVRGQVSFSGGNPLLHPDFLDLYQAAADRNLITAILGNPTSPKKLEQICAIKKPAFYQVSLEGLQEHNDYIRGTNHFKRVFAFLAILKEFDIYSMVMLTLTRANQSQVLPLADMLADKVDLYTFNRLAMVGEGASLQSVKKESYEDFLKTYLEVAPHNAALALKDNLLNIPLREKKGRVFGGCAGNGCGAAFNFVSILPDGECHACRKFPSYIGNAFDKSLADIYHSDLAEKYRQGPSECAKCAIRPVCGGCLAVTHGFGLDVFKEKDPYCFI